MMAGVGRSLAFSGTTSVLALFSLCCCCCCCCSSSSTKWSVSTFDGVDVNDDVETERNSTGEGGGGGTVAIGSLSTSTSSTLASSSVRSEMIASKSSRSSSKVNLLLTILTPTAACCSKKPTGDMCASRSPIRLLSVVVVLTDILTNFDEDDEPAQVRNCS